MFEIIESEDDDTDRAALCEFLKLDKCTQIISIQQIIDLLPESVRLRAENDKLRKKEIELIIKGKTREKPHPILVKYFNDDQAKWLTFSSVIANVVHIIKLDCGASDAIIKYF